MENNEVIMVEEPSNKKINLPFILRVVGYIALLITVVSLFAGLYKLFVYESPYNEEFMIGEDYEVMYDEEKGINTYNVMDVQDLTVNSGLATAYFTLSILFTIIGIGSFVLAELIKRDEQMFMQGISKTREI